MRGSCVRANQLEKERTINWDHQLREEGLLLSVGPRVWLPVLSNGMKAIAHLSNLIQFFFFFCLRCPPQLPSRGECTDDDDWLIFCQPPINNKFLLFAFAVQPPFLLSSPIRKDRKRVEPDHWRVWPVSFSKSPPFHPSQRNWCGYGFPWPANSLESLPSSLRNNRTRWLKGSAATWKENNRGGRSRDPLEKMLSILASRVDDRALGGFKYIGWRSSPFKERNNKRPSGRGLSSLWGSFK